MTHQSPNDSVTTAIKAARRDRRAAIRRADLGSKLGADRGVAPDRDDEGGAAMTARASAPSACVPLSPLGETGMASSADTSAAFMAVKS